MYTKKSSRLEVRNVWPTELFPSDVLGDNDDNNNGGGCSASDLGGSDTHVRPRKCVPARKHR